jgi:hypothetical protein
MLNKKAIRRVHPFLKVISKLDNKDRQVILHFLTHEACAGIYECVENGLTNHTLREEDRQEMHKTLVPQKNKFRKLLAEQDPEKKKRQLLQVGSGVGLILEKVVPLLDEYLKTK